MLGADRLGIVPVREDSLPFPRLHLLRLEVHRNPVVNITLEPPLSQRTI